MDGIYLDNHASTRCDQRVVEAMIPYLCGSYGNAASLENNFGRCARRAVDHARFQVAGMIGAKPNEIVFTSGATESNNLAILGIARMRKGNRNRIVTSAIEHKSVLETCRKLADEGYEVIELPVDRKGRLDPDEAVEEINERTLLVSIQAANNEIGTLQDIQSVSLLARRNGAAFHCDAAQAAGRIPLDMASGAVDLLSISAHKMYGPKGIGALYLQGGVRNLSLQPLFFGGGQEWELRPGTLNVPAIVGFGEACRIAERSMHHESARIAALRDRFERLLVNILPALKINGSTGNRLPNNSSITFPGIGAGEILSLCHGVALSTGSACNCASSLYSHVLTAIGLSPREILCTVRVGLGRFNTTAELDQAANAIIRAVKHLGGARVCHRRELKWGQNADGLCP